MTASGRQALVVDDVPSNRKLAAAFLARLNWQVAEADGGQAALDWIAENSGLDLLLLDISMPGLSGEEVCRRLRDNPTVSALPIVAYTAHALPADIERFLLNGFDAVLIKPISMQALKDVIATIFED